MKMETETGVMLPQVKDLLQLPELEEARKDPPQEALEGAWPCRHLDFRLLVSRTVREKISYKPSSLWYLVMAALGKLKDYPVNVSSVSKLFTRMPSCSCTHKMQLCGNRVNILLEQGRGGKRGLLFPYLVMTLTESGEGPRSKLPTETGWFAPAAC